MGENVKKFNLDPKKKKMITDYLLAVAAAAVTMGVALITDMAPQYAVLIGALTAPLTKWASVHSKDYGRTKE